MRTLTITLGVFAVLVGLLAFGLNWYLGKFNLLTLGGAVVGIGVILVGRSIPKDSLGTNQ